MKYLLPFTLMFAFTAEACFLKKPVSIDLEKLQAAGELVYQNVQTTKGPAKLTLTLLEDVVASNLETHDGKVWGPDLTEKDKRVYKELYALSEKKIVHTVKNIYDYVTSDFRVVEIEYPKSHVWLGKNILSSIEIEDMVEVLGANGERLGFNIESVCVNKI